MSPADYGCTSLVLASTNKRCDEPRFKIRATTCREAARCTSAEMCVEQGSAACLIRGAVRCMRRMCGRETIRNILNCPQVFVPHHLFVLRRFTRQDTGSMSSRLVCGSPCRYNAVSWKLHHALSKARARRRGAVGVKGPSWLLSNRRPGLAITRQTMSRNDTCTLDSLLIFMPLGLPILVTKNSVLSSAYYPQS